MLTLNLLKEKKLNQLETKIKRRDSLQISVGAVPVGGDSPISVQSMTNSNTEDVKATVSQIKELEDAGKPVISEYTMHVINDAVNHAVENYDFDNRDQYEIDFSLDYDSRIQAETINLTDTYELVEAIVTKIEKQFKVIKDDETND